jgi:hypothetical protein
MEFATAGHKKPARLFRAAAAFFLPGFSGLRAHNYLRNKKETFLFLVGFSVCFFNKLKRILGSGSFVLQTGPSTKSITIIQL